MKFFSKPPHVRPQKTTEPLCQVEIRIVSRERLRLWAQSRKVYGSADDVLTKLLDTVQAPIPDHIPPREQRRRRTAEPSTG